MRNDMELLPVQLQNTITASEKAEDRLEDGGVSNMAENKS